MLNRIYLNVPKNIKYIGNWSELTNLLPKGHYILNKIVTGCGFTEFFLNNPIPTILCSPRKVLLENKFEQHLKKGRFTYLYRNIYDSEENVDIGNSEKMNNVSKIEDPQDILRYNRDLKSYIESNYNIFNDVIPKILVTYDSLWHVLEVINNISPTLLEQFQIVVDEFQSIFSDASFKATTELNFLGYLQNVPNVCYLSATPVLDRYLSELDEFKNLPYYELAWPKERLIQPKYEKKKVKSIPEACYNIIQEYKNGIYPRKYYNNQIIESKEVVFYINSVTDICKIIKKADLKDYEVNVICAHDSKNLKKLKKVGINGYGKVPLENDPHKMFTFCTRTVYLGTDFYSTCASTVICSDCNLSNMSLDISLDLPQILGRQRLETNLFRFNIKFFYKTSAMTIPIEEFNNYILKKSEDTKEMINTYNDITQPNRKNLQAALLRKDVLSSRYKDNYVCVKDTPYGPQAVFNKLVLLSEQRAWEIQQLNYKDETSVLGSFEEEGWEEILYKEETVKYIEDFLQDFSQNNNFEDQMRKYCSFLEKFPMLLGYLTKIPEIPSMFHLYYELLGPKIIKSKSYKEKELTYEVKIHEQNPEIRDRIIISFIPDHKYSNKDIKIILQNIYSDLGLKKVAKAGDINEYLLTERTQFIQVDSNGNKKKVEGLKIIGLK